MPTEPTFNSKCICGRRGFCIPCVLADEALEAFLDALTAFQELGAEVWSYADMRWKTVHNYKEEIYEIALDSG